MGKLAPGKKKSEGVKIHVRIRHPHRGCDRCGVAHDGVDISRARFEITTNAGVLYLCGHHFHRHHKHILEMAYLTKDWES